MDKAGHFEIYGEFARERNLKYWKVSGLIAAGLMALTGTAHASGDTDYRCAIGLDTAHVHLSASKPYATYKDSREHLRLQPNGRDGYINKKARMSFNDKGKRAVLRIKNQSFLCDQVAQGRPHDGHGRPDKPRPGGAPGNGHGGQAGQGDGTPGLSLGGKLRAGPGTRYRQTGSLQEGQRLTILRNAGVSYNGFDWFEVATASGQRGFQWGGIMCSAGPRIDGVFKSCGRRPGPSRPGPGQGEAPDPGHGTGQGAGTPGLSLGGKLRSGPGTNFRQVGSLQEGQRLTILRNAGVSYNGFDWFEVKTANGQRGFQWGGIMCSAGQRIDGIFKSCGRGAEPSRPGPGHGHGGGQGVSPGLSLGGKLRSGPGTSFPQTGSLSEGSRLTILRNSGVSFNGYDWFEVTTAGGQRGFQWGGIMCSAGRQLPGIYQACGR
ncbi:SH3 domain-containing protein [Rhodobacterales bacterium]|nr:SH3 domain-containing protein [Rhodobacterales bacterium]